MIKIAVPGVGGRMGQAVAKAVLQSDSLQLALATARSTSGLVGNKVANSNIAIDNKLSNPEFDVLIDFTLPEGVIEHLQYCVANNKAMIIGSTGFTAEHLEVINEAADKIPIVMASNMSLGVNICYKLLAQASNMLTDSEVSIEDVHHEHKKDSPSGTAKSMAKVICDNSDRELSDVTMISQRRGETIGSHVVTFKSKYDTIAISHEANNRDIYAEGATTAAKWIVNKPSGLYSMLDVID